MEGTLSKIRAALVNEKPLALLARGLRLAACCCWEKGKKIPAATPRILS